MSIRGIWNRVFGKAKPSKVVEMDEADSVFIRMFAVADVQKGQIDPAVAHRIRQYATDAYTRYLPTLGPRGNLEMQYITEVLAPVQDVILRRLYREELVVIAKKDRRASNLLSV